MDYSQSLHCMGLYNYTSRNRSNQFLVCVDFLSMQLPMKL